MSCSTICEIVVSVKVVPHAEGRFVKCLPYVIGSMTSREKHKFQVWCCLCVCVCVCVCVWKYHVMGGNQTGYGSLARLMKTLTEGGPCCL